MVFRVDLPRGAGWALAALLLTSCAGQMGACKLLGAIDLPVTTRNRSFSTNMLIDGAPATMRIDTGSFVDLLTEATAKRLGLRQSRSGDLSMRGIGGQQTLSLATSHAVSLGGARATNVDFLTIGDRDFSTDMDGVLGMPFLEPYDDDLDFAHGHLRLIAPQGNCSEPASPLTGTVFVVPLLRAYNSGSPIIAVVIRGVKLHAVIDTGSPFSLLFRSTALRIGVPADKALRETRQSIRGFGPNRKPAAFGRLRLAIQIGGLDINNLPFALIDDIYDRPADMLLGYDFVMAVHVWISHSSKTVLLQYPAEATPTGGPPVGGPGG